MKSFLSLIALVLFFFAAPLYAENCGDPCDFPEDCLNPICGICNITCQGCSDLTNSADCTDTNSGAADKCYWTGTTCESLGAVPELPDGWKWLIAGCGALIAFKVARRPRPSTR